MTVTQSFVTRPLTTVDKTLVRRMAAPLQGSCLLRFRRPLDCLSALGALYNYKVFEIILLGIIINIDSCHRD